MSNTAPSEKRRIIQVFGVFLLLLCLFTTLPACHQYRHRKDASDTASCANHSHQHSLRLRLVAGDHPDLLLPSTNDTCAALMAIYTSYGQDTLTNAQRWVNHPGSACPESYRRDGSIGYVYVGDGLRLGDVEEKGILILYCPGENHRGSSEHCHAYSLADRGRCVFSNEGMIGELKHAIARGESGEVRYSTRAMTVLRQELEKRQKPR